MRNASETTRVEILCTSECLNKSLVKRTVSRDLYVFCLSGINKFFENMKEMIGYYPFIWWKFAWTVTCPAMCAVRPALFLLQLRILLCLIMYIRM